MFLFLTQYTLYFNSNYQSSVVVVVVVVALVVTVDVTVLVDGRFVYMCLC